MNIKKGIKETYKIASFLFSLTAAVMFVITGGGIIPLFLVMVGEVEFNSFVAAVYATLWGVLLYVNTSDN